MIAAERTAGEPLLLAGFSFGAYVATHAAKQLAEPARRLVLVGPATSRFDTTTVPADTLVIHGEQDDVVPLASVLDWARPQSLPVVVRPAWAISSTASCRCSSVWSCPLSIADLMIRRLVAFLAAACTQLVQAQAPQPPEIAARNYC